MPKDMKELFDKEARKLAIATFTIGWLMSYLERFMPKDEIEKEVALSRIKANEIFR